MRLVVADSKTPMKALTADESLPYIRQMLGELRTQAVGVDCLLVHLIEMAQMHAIDLQNGAAKRQSRIGE